jgi:hypothetical protein
MNSWEAGEVGKIGWAFDDIFQMYALRITIGAHYFTFRGVIHYITMRLMIFMVFIFMVVDIDCMHVICFKAGGPRVAWHAD